MVVWNCNKYYGGKLEPIQDLISQFWSQYCEGLRIWLYRDGNVNIQPENVELTDVITGQKAIQGK